MRLDIHFPDSLTVKDKNLNKTTVSVGFEKENNLAANG
jgi:hypothetical protein